ncbi:MAG: hypothetical protein EA396_02165 [Anaerolineaceae bacterium]|nr:MAG: hypothetical protein EA396_02165 [Anaerolineaceae bacterium]
MKQLTLIIAILLLWSSVSADSLRAQIADDPTPTPEIDFDPDAESELELELEPEPEPETEVETSAPVQATPTDLPDVADFIINWDDDVLYPAGLFFSLSINAPLDEVANITLTLNIEGETAPRNIGFAAIREAVTDDVPATRIALTWATPPDNPPPFQALIDYVWRVTLSDGRQGEVPGTLSFKEAGRAWVIDADDEGRVNLIYAEGTSDALRSRVDALYALLAARLEVEPALSLALNPANAPIDPCERVDQIIGARTGQRVACDDDAQIGRVMMARLGYDIIDAPTNAQAISQTIDAVASAFHAPRWDGGALPDWFTRGLFALYRASDRFTDLQRVRVAERTATQYDMDAMQTAIDAITDGGLWTSQAIMMTLFVADAYGLDALYALADEPFLPDEPFEARYARLTGDALSRLIPAMNNWLYLGRVLDVVRFDPYQTEPTPTPTITLTATAFPATATFTPTHTPTATATFTATPSPTVTGTLSATPLPSSTPTNTPLPPPPTITPLPPDFQFPTVPPPAQPEITVTPTIATPPPATDDISAEDWALLVLTALVILSAGAGIMMMLRRR